MSDVIRDFLFRIRYDENKEEQKKFEGGIASAGKRLAGVAMSVVASVSAMTAAMAVAGNDMYFTSQRTGAGVKDIMAFENALSTMGVSAAEARSALEGLAEFRRTYGSGASSFLEGLGVLPENVGDDVETMKDLARTIKDMDIMTAKARLGPLGFSDEMILAMQRDGFAYGVGEYGAAMEAAGVDYKTATENSKALYDEIAKLGLQFKVMGGIIQEETFPAISKFVRDQRYLMDLINRTVGGTIRGTADGIDLRPSAIATWPQRMKVRDIAKQEGLTGAQADALVSDLMAVGALNGKDDLIFDPIKDALDNSGGEVMNDAFAFDNRVRARAKKFKKDIYDQYWGAHGSSAVSGGESALDGIYLQISPEELFNTGPMGNGSAIPMPPRGDTKVEQSNTVNIYGNTDTKTVDDIREKLRDNNKDLIRMMQGAVQ